MRTLYAVADSHRVNNIPTLVRLRMKETPKRLTLIVQKGENTPFGYDGRQFDHSEIGRDIFETPLQALQGYVDDKRKHLDRAEQNVIDRREAFDTAVRFVNDLIAADSPELRPDADEPQ